MAKECIIIGGGKSVREGLSSGLWDKIKGNDIWALNYSYKLMPYLPTRLCFVDYSFFKNNQTDLLNLAENNVPIYTKSDHKYEHIASKFIKQYDTVKIQAGFRGRKALDVKNNSHLFVGRMGLVGCFALSLAIAEGYTTIYMLGYDFGNSSLEDKDTHWYQNDISVKSSGVGNPRVYISKIGLKKEVEDFAVFNNVDDLTLLNVSVSSNIPYFQKITYEDFYTYLKKENDESIAINASI